MNPFKEKPQKPEHYLQNLHSLYPVPYDKNTVDPYTKTRIILAAGAEFEANWHSHRMHRRIPNPDLRRDLALVRMVEKEQQQKLAMLKPLNESVLETTITYEQLAVDLTAEMARRENNFYFKKALDFALLEDFDHLYRYANLLSYDDNISAERLVGKYTEITPGRPTVAHHRHPMDNVKKHLDSRENDMQTNLHTMIITAAEQQTMNYYMNVGGFYKTDAGRRLYEEICLVEEEHVTQYGSLIDTSHDLLECNLLNEYAECYVYWSNYMTETDERIKAVWEQFYEMELSHLHAANRLLKKYKKQDYGDIIACPDFPEPLSLHENIDYVREVIATTVQYTGKQTDYTNIEKLPDDDRFFVYNNEFTKPMAQMPSHTVIEDHVTKKGKDYRFQTEEHPIPALQSRENDNVEVGISPKAAKSIGFRPNKRGK